MKPAAAGSWNAGFTLVEALVATLLMGLICAALAAVTAQWIPNWNHGLLTLQRTQLAAEGLDRLTDDLADAEFITAGHGNDPPFFDGSELSVVFVRSKLAPNGGPGIEVVRLAETRSDDGPALVRSTATLPTGSGGSASTANLEFTDPVVVIRAPYRVSFSYAGPDRLWRNDWRAEPELPRAVRIRVLDDATSELLAASTSTLIHAELAARCTWAVGGTNCPGSPGPPQNGAASTDSTGGR